MVHCDSFSVVSSLNSGCVQDKLLVACLGSLPLTMLQRDLKKT